MYIVPRPGPGVYQIRNLVTGRVYIGSSVNPRQRWHCHRGGLRKGIHSNPWLQRSWNKYKEESFVFEVLLSCSKEQLVSREQRLLNATCKKYNVARAATPGPYKPRVVWTLARRRRQSKLMRGNTHLRGHKLSPELRALHIARLALHWGAPRSEAWRRKVQLRMRKLNREMNWQRPQNQPGRTLTEEQRRKCGKPLSKSHIRTLRKLAATRPRGVNGQWK